MQEVLHQLLLVVGSWERTVTKCLGVTQSIWQCQLQDGFFPRGVRATAYGALQCPFFLCLQPLTWLGSLVEPTHRPPVVASHTSLWPLRRPLRSVPATCRSCKRQHVALSLLMPLVHTRGAWPLVACKRSTQSPLNKQEASHCP